MLNRLLRFIVGIIVVATIPAGAIIGLLIWVITGRPVINGVANWIIIGEYDED